MFNLADIILVILVAFFIMLGYKNGLIRSVIHLTSFFVCGIITFVLFPIIKQLIQFDRLVDMLSIGLRETGMAIITPQITSFLLSIVLAFVIYMLLKAIVSLLGEALDGIAKLPVLKQVNKITGALLGLIQGMVVVYFVLGILSLIYPTASGLSLYGYIEKSIYVKSIYDNNLLLSLIWR